MSQRSRFVLVLLSSFLLCLGYALPALATSPSLHSVVNANGPNPTVLPVGSRPYGASYGEWSARFWQWAYSMPIDQHPLFDTAGCDEQQSGKVWFLGSSFAPTVTDGGQVVAIADRTCSIPSGTALFIPIVNSEASTIEGNGTTEAELRAAADFFQDFAQNLSCDVDGFVIQNLDGYRVQSPLFTFGPLPENNVLQWFGYDAPAGSTSDSVGDGVFVMLAPLAVGPHTIHFHGEVPAFNFLLDITYHLTVTPRGGVTEDSTVDVSGAPGSSKHSTTWGLLKTRY